MLILKVCLVVGMTREIPEYYLKALRALLNKAIQEKEASEITDPFGKGGFNIGALEEETAKRYLPQDSMEKLKTTIMSNRVLETARRLFLFSYYCYSISFIDAALLTKQNIMRYNGGSSVVYKRNNKNLAKQAEALEITDMKLTSYVSRHTMAMTLQDNQVSREVISPILGHSDLATTNTYFG